MPDFLQKVGPEQNQHRHFLHAKRAHRNWSRRLLCIFAAVALVGLATFMHGSASVAALSETQRGRISQNCGSIQQSLRQLQVADSRTRVYLGSIYETVLSDYLTPLATRVANNNLSLNTFGASLITQQSDFSVSRSSFSSTYISYQRALEELVDYDCRTDPDGFYEKLEAVREQRADLAALVAQIRAKLTTHQTTVQSLRNQLSADEAVDDESDNADTASTEGTE